jgi:hypothetical protein
LKCSATEVSAVAVDIIKFNEKGELISPKVAPEITAPTEANIKLSIINGSDIFKLIIRIERGMTVVAVRKKEPHKKLIKLEKRKKIRGRNEITIDLLNKVLMSDVDNPNFLARDSIDIARMI